jgi:ubiquinone/menaquinone biosynthesis C-methylase UbiE
MACLAEWTFKPSIKVVPMNDDPADRKAQTRTQFNTIATDYDAGPGCFAHFGRRLVAAANIESGQRLLDVASGRGAVLFPCAEQIGETGDAVGIDLADEMAHATNEEAARRGLAARVQVMDAENLDFPDEAFDRVLCGFGVMFFLDQDRALGEFRRVLKPGGRLAMSTWRITQCSELEAVMAELGMRRPKPPGWITESEDLSRLLARAGFTNVRVDEDEQSFRYADADEYWRQARGTGMRRTLDSLDAIEAKRVRAALADRLRPHKRQDGFYLVATALLAVANR